MISSVQYFNVKTKMFADFQICISVPLITKAQLIQQSLKSGSGSRLVGGVQWSEPDSGPGWKKSFTP